MSATVPTNRKDVASTIVSELRGAGMSDNGIRGILANVQDESGFDPNLRHWDQPHGIGEGAYAHGLYQEGAGEWNNYAAWLNKNNPGSSWQDPALQTRFLARNLQQNYPGVWKSLNEGSAEDAAQAFVNGYLRPKAEHAARRSAQYSRGIPELDAYTGGQKTAMANTGTATDAAPGGPLPSTFGVAAAPDPDTARLFGHFGDPTNASPATASASAAPDPDTATLFGHFGHDPNVNASPELTPQQRDTITRWGLNPSNFTRQTAPLETAEGLRDPKTNELVMAGNHGWSGPQWGAGQAVASGALQGLGPKLQAAEASLQPGAPSDAYEQAKAAYGGARQAYNANHPITGTGSEVAGSLTTGIPLMATGAGALEAGGSAAARAAPWLARAEPVADFMAGRGGSNMLTRGLSLATAGAGTGAANALLSQNLSDAPISDQIATGALLGGGLGAGVPAVVGALKGAGRAIEPFTESGRNAIVDRVINQFAGDNPAPAIVGPGVVRGANELIPGSTPTLAQATANPGIAALERGVHDASPLSNRLLAERKALNQTARDNALSAIRGDEASLDNLIQAREAATDPLRDAAFKNATGPANPSNVLGKIDEILAGPSGQRDPVVSSLGNIRKKLVKGTATMPDGSTMHVLQDDPRQLYGIRQAIGDLLSPLAQNPETKLAAKELMQVKGELDNSIEAAAPGFKGYLAKFSEMSNPVDTQQLLQKMKVYDTNGNITAGSMDRAITQIERGRAAGGANQAKSISDADLKTLYALRDDLRREGNSSLGKAIGSNTVQNLATNNLMAMGGLPVGVMAGLHVGGGLLGAAASAGGWALRHMYAKQNEPVLQALTNRLLNPNPSTVNRLLNPAAPTSPLVNSLAPFYIPAANEGYRGLQY